MTDEERIQLQDEAYEHMLRMAARENDSEKAQQWSKAIESFERGRNERANIELTYSINDAKIVNENKIATSKLENEKDDNEKRLKLERRKTISDSIVKWLTLGVSALGLAAAYWEDITSYTKNLESKREARNMLKNNK